MPIGWVVAGCKGAGRVTGARMLARCTCPVHKAVTWQLVGMAGTLKWPLSTLLYGQRCGLAARFALKAGCSRTAGSMTNGLRFG